AGVFAELHDEGIGLAVDGHAGDVVIREVNEGADETETKAPAGQAGAGAGAFGVLHVPKKMLLPTTITPESLGAGKGIAWMRTPLLASRICSDRAIPVPTNVMPPASVVGPKDCEA